MKLSGHSGSHPHMHKGLVRKHSSYQDRCSESDYQARVAFLLSLNEHFPHMPKLNFLGDRTIEIGFINGREGLDGIDYRKFGEIVKKLHNLKIEPQKDTGLYWLLSLAEESMKRAGLDLETRLLDWFRVLNDDPVVHGEITQLITTPNGALYIIDWDECGLGNRYQDLGFVYYALLERELGLEPFQAFMDGYGDNRVEFSLVKDTAGLIALAYASFYDFERRLELGRRLLLEQAQIPVTIIIMALSKH